MAETPKTRHRSFGTAGKKSVPITFDVAGEEFTARGSLPGITVVEFAEKSKEGGLSTINDIFEMALLPESHERFDTLIHDPEKEIDLETLTEIMGWLVEQYTSRPTKAS